MNIQLVNLFRFPRRRNVLFALFFVFSLTLILVGTSNVQAQAAPPTLVIDKPLSPEDTQKVKDAANNTQNAKKTFRADELPSAPKGADLLGVAPTASKENSNSPWQWVKDGFQSAIDWLLNLVLSLEAFFASVAISIFAMTIDPQAFDIVMRNNTVIYEIWKITRDTMNMFFILVLLFSAFATIFQIDKYKYNKILLMVIIMALLVNFSWPISRAIIDFFNSMMYFFINSVFHTTGGITAGEMLSVTEMKSVFLPESGQASGMQLLLAIVIMFIFTITLLVLALMMLIRLVALPIIVMFAPVGFAGMIAPITQGYAKKWWDKLFQYASYGPIAVFMVLVALTIAKSVNGQRSTLVATMKGLNAGWTTQLVTEVAFFAIPIVLFWIAITSAEKMSGELSGGVTKYGIAFGKWAGRQPWRLAQTTGIPGGISQAWKDRKAWWTGAAFSTKNATRRQEAMEAQIAAGLSGGRSGWNNAAKRFEDKKLTEKVEELKKSGISNSLLEQTIGDGNKSNIDTKAAALLLAEREAFTNAGKFASALAAMGEDAESAAKLVKKVPAHAMKASAAEYGKIINSDAFKKDPSLQRQLESRMKKEGQMQTIINYRTASQANGGLGENVDVVYKDVIGGMSFEELAKQKPDFHQSRDLKNYAINDIATDPTGKAREYYEKAFEEMSRGNQSEWLGVI